MADPIDFTEAIGLVYVSDEEPGYARKRCGRGFTYFHPDGTRVRDAELRARFADLVIPPAWTDVWICLEPNGHLQATGRDDADRKQYVYHPTWAEMRNQAKFASLYQFGCALPEIRAHVAADLRKHNLPYEKVLALTVALLDEAHLRIGNRRYAQQNGSFGLTTLMDDHAEISGRHVLFEFMGKSGVEHHVDVQDARLARLVKACQELPGQRLFQYVDAEGVVRAVESGDVNSYLRTIVSEDFSAKDFRTWAGTVAAVKALQQIEQPGKTAQAREQEIVAAVKQVAEVLGNTPAVCRKYYIHPAIFDSHLTGDLRKASSHLAKKLGDEADDLAEQVVLHILQKMGYAKPKGI